METLLVLLDRRKLLIESLLTLRIELNLRSSGLSLSGTILLVVFRSVRLPRLLSRRRFSSTFRMRRIGEILRSMISKSTVQVKERRLVILLLLFLNLSLNLMLMRNELLS
jgi:hypothetical protein